MREGCAKAWLVVITIVGGAWFAKFLCKGVLNPTCLPRYVSCSLIWNLTRRAGRLHGRSEARRSLGIRAVSNGGIMRTIVVKRRGKISGLYLAAGIKKRNREARKTAVAADPRLDYQPLFGKMSPHSSPERFSGRIKDRTRETAEIEPKQIHTQELLVRVS